MGLNLKSTPGNPTAHHVLPYQPVLDIVFAAAITGVLALTGGGVCRSEDREKREGESGMNREGRTRKAALCIVALAVAAACLAFAFIHPAASTVRQDLAVSHDAPGPVELPVPDDGTVAQGTAPVFATELCHSSWLTIEAPRPGVQRTRCTLVEPNQ